MIRIAPTLALALALALPLGARASAQEPDAPPPTPTPEPIEAPIEPPIETEALPTGPQPLSGDPGWQLLGAAGAGPVMLNSAGGQHQLTPELTVHAALRLSDLVTTRTVVHYAWRRQGTPDIWIENGYTVLVQRADLTLGTDRAQFVAGAGPGLVHTTTRLHGPGAGIYTHDLDPILAYGVGLRLFFRRKVPIAVDFGGQQRVTRHDFRATFSVGVPLRKSRRAREVSR